MFPIKYERNEIQEVGSFWETLECLIGDEKTKKRIANILCLLRPCIQASATLMIFLLKLDEFLMIFEKTIFSTNCRKVSTRVILRTVLQF